MKAEKTVLTRAQRRRPPASRPEPPPPRVVIENVRPVIDGGRYAIKRTVGEPVEVTATVFADGHDAVAAALLHRRAGSAAWQESPMELVNAGLDQWRGRFPVEEMGGWEYTVCGWVDRLESWRRDLQKKAAAAQDLAVDLLAGAELVEAAAARAKGADRKRLEEFAQALRGPDAAAAVALALEEHPSALVKRYAARHAAATYEKVLPVIADRERARFSAWYEMFPRSAAPEPGRHGTFRDCEARLDYIASMGFDVLYFPPIHPIGRTHRKGRNNNPVRQPGEPGSPWAIGSDEGGHKAIHAELGTAEDFRRLVTRAREKGLEVALDIAFQCSPDHPYVKDHPEWFRWRPDGTIQYAENPPKKYQDIYPLEFENEHWRELWEELKSVVVHWAAEGVRIFRVDNPHTKPLAFWEWLIAEVKREYPDVILLSEAFTRPPMMYRLAKLGFTQSYTYFAWRNTAADLAAYLTELTQTEVREYFRPSFWPNTPDILTEYLQTGGRPASIARLVLAATLAASYGIYGPVFELCETTPLIPGREEYLNAEKYEIRHWPAGKLDSRDSLRDLITRVNRARREHPALQSDRNLLFHATDNDQLIAYSKSSDDGADLVLVVVNLDPRHTQSGWVTLDLDRLGLDAARPFQVHDLLTGDAYQWNGARNYVQLDPRAIPAHLFHVHPRARTAGAHDSFT